MKFILGLIIGFIAYPLLMYWLLKTYKEPTEKEQKVADWVKNYWKEWNDYFKNHV